MTVRPFKRLPFTNFTAFSTFPLDVKIYIKRVELKDMLTGLKRKSGRCMGGLVLDYSSER
jgi:hypothetical protein